MELEFRPTSLGRNEKSRSAADVKITGNTGTGNTNVPAGVATTATASSTAAAAAASSAAASALTNGVVTPRGVNAVGDNVAKLVNLKSRQPKVAQLLYLEKCSEPQYEDFKERLLQYYSAKAGDIGRR